MHRTLVLLAALPSAATAQPCGQWIAPFNTFGGLASRPHAIVAFDPDGPGPTTPQLIVGGSFTHADGQLVNRIARWDGTRWQAMASGVGNVVRALHVHDPDDSGPVAPQLIAVGDFSNRLALWTGASWNLPGDMFASLQDVTTFDFDEAGPLLPQIVACGFTTNYPRTVARWDGSQWHTVGDGRRGTIRALTTWDPDGPGPQRRLLVAGGDPSTDDHLAAFDGANWFGWASPNDSIYDLTTWDPDGAGPENAQLIVAGFFTVVGGQTVNFIARYSSFGWTPLGEGFNQPVVGLTTWDPDGSGPLGSQLIAVGFFTASGSTPISKVARWDGAAWHPLSGSFTNSATVNCAATWDPDGSGPAPEHLVVGGDFTSVGPVTTNYIAAYIPCALSQCSADMNGDNAVNSADLSILLSQFGQSVAPGTGGDSNNDGSVNSADLSVLLSNFGSAC